MRAARRRKALRMASREPESPGSCGGGAARTRGRLCECTDHLRRCASQCTSSWHAARHERVLLDHVRGGPSDGCVQAHVGASEAPLGSGWEGLLSSPVSSRRYSNPNPACSLAGGGKARARLTPMFPFDYDSGSESDDACPRVVPDRDYEVAILMQQAESAHFGSERREPAGDAEFAQHFAGEVRPRTSPA